MLARHDQGMNAPLYNRDILRLAASIPYHRRLTDAQASVEKRSATCGSSVTVDVRSEEHTSELKSLMRISYAVFCLNKLTIDMNILNNATPHCYITTIPHKLHKY